MLRTFWRRSGFTLIELMIAVSIIAILAATSIPAYATYVRNVRLLAAELSLVNALKTFSVGKEYSPASGMLADLVTEGFLTEIPNDPWTAPAGGPATGAGEAVDWYYENDGDQLYLYARSHPGRLYTLPSFGLPPLAEVPGSTQPPDTTPDNSKDKGKGKGKNKNKGKNKGSDKGKNKGN